MIDIVIVVLLVFFGVILFLASLFDKFLFYYKKTPGRGYAQMAKPGKPRWLISLFSNLEFFGFLGFIVVCLVIVWRLG